MVEKDADGVTIELNVQLNFELEKEILGMGEGIVVLSPDRLRRNITRRLKQALNQYNVSG